MQKHTQAQMLWHMKFNELVGTLELYTRSHELWDGRTKRGSETSRKEAKQRAHEVATGLDRARNALEVFVTSTPYPKGE